MPHASPDREERSGQLPHLRNGARAPHGDEGRIAQSGARRHDEAILDQHGTRRPARRLACADFLPEHALALSPAVVSWAELLLATPVVSGAACLSSCALAVDRNRSFNMFTLIALGRGAAYLYSLIATFLPGRLAAHSAGCRAWSPTYFEPAAVIVTLVLLGQVLELRARSQTGAAIRALLGLAPKTARRLEADGTEDESLSTRSSRRSTCECAPAKRCPSMAPFSKERAPSTSR